MPSPEQKGYETPFPLERHPPCPDTLPEHVTPCVSGGGWVYGPDLSPRLEFSGRDPVTRIVSFVQAQEFVFRDVPESHAFFNRYLFFYKGCYARNGVLAA
jgi:hypothetical protein